MLCSEILRDSRSWLGMFVELGRKTWEDEDSVAEVDVKAENQWQTTISANRWPDAMYCEWNDFPTYSCLK